MIQTRFHFASACSLLILMSVAAEPAYATGPNVQVCFWGDKGLNGYFIYDSSLSGTGGVYDFNGKQPPYVHSLSYSFTSSPGPVYSSTGCESFKINLNGTLAFNLAAHGPLTTLVTINLATTTQLPQSPLPTCTNAYFVAAPTGTQSTFATLAQGSTTATTYNITKVTCKNLLTAPLPTPPPIYYYPCGVSYPVYICPPQQRYYYYYACPTPTVYPVYVYQPRPAWCLPRYYYYCR